MMVVEGEEVLGVVRNDNHPLYNIVFTAGGLYEYLELEFNDIDMVTNLPLKIHERGELTVKPGIHVFIPKVGTEDHVMNIIKRFTGRKKY